MLLVIQDSTSVNRYGYMEMESAGHKLTDQLLNQTEGFLTKIILVQFSRLPFSETFEQVPG